MGMNNLAIIILGIICLIQLGIIVFLFKIYRELLEEIVRVRVPGMVLPRYRNEIEDKIQEDKKLQEERQMRQDFLDVIKSGECNDIDIKKFGVEIDA